MLQQIQEVLVKVFFEEEGPRSWPFKLKIAAIVNPSNIGLKIIALTLNLNDPVDILVLTKPVEDKLTKLL